MVSDVTWYSHGSIAKMYFYIDAVLFYRYQYDFQIFLFSVIYSYSNLHYTEILNSLFMFYTLYIIVSAI